MAISDATLRADIRYFLGASGVHIIAYDPIEQAMDDATSAVETQVSADITAVKAIDTELTSVRGKLCVERVGDIHLAGGRGVASLRSEGRRLVARIASYLGVSVVSDVFAGGGSLSVYRMPA